MERVTPLTEESEALLAEVHGTQMALTVFPARLRAIETAAARRALEGSGVVEALRSMVSSWMYEWDMDCSPRAWADFDARLAALPRPEEPRVERKVAKDIDAAVDELERLFHPEGRCALCGGGKPYWKHDMGTYSDHPEGHPFTPEAR